MQNSFNICPELMMQRSVSSSFPRSGMGNSGGGNPMGRWKCYLHMWYFDSSGCFHAHYDCYDEKGNYISFFYNCGEYHYYT